LPFRRSATIEVGLAHESPAAVGRGVDVVNETPAVSAISSSRTGTRLFQVPSQRAPLHPLTLSFLSDELQRRFKNQFRPERLTLARVSLWLALGVYLSFDLAEPFIVPDAPPDIRLIRIASSVLFLSAVAATYHQRVYRYFQVLMSFVVVAGGLGVIGMVMAASEPHQVSVYYVGLILAIIYAHVLLHLRFIYATLSSCAVIIMYAAIAPLSAGGSPDAVIVGHIYFLAAANMMGMFASYGLEYFVKTVYWQNRLLAEQSTELAREHARKSDELEAVRRIQLSLLPEHPPQFPGYEFGFYMSAATEIGGDYYDYCVSDDGSLTLAIGDATGHGARASAMVTATKLLFTNRGPQLPPAAFLREASRSLRLMRLRQLYMAFAVARVSNGTVTLAGAGIPPALLVRAGTGVIEQTSLKGLPLGSPVAYDYVEQVVSLDPGDTLVLMSDGLPERANTTRELLGDEAIMYVLRRHGHEAPDALIQHLLDAGDAWSDGTPQNDDITLVVLRCRRVAPHADGAINSSQPPV
jgi:hypothetical protein